ALYDDAVMVRAHAAGSLGAFAVEREDALALCAVALKDEAWSVRANALNSAAALALSAPETPDSMELVKEKLEDSHPEVRRRARLILVKAGMPVPAGEEEDWMRSTQSFFE
ncbi:MAG: HEAT repeat domain-containing protein, partial [Limisphaerales bacterium]